MAWTTKISHTAAKQLKKMDKTVQNRIYQFLSTKIENKPDPRLYGKALRGKKSELWRYRIGDYRLICQIDDSIVTVLVLTIGHRKEVYDS